MMMILMRTIHALGYALGAAFISLIGTALTRSSGFPVFASLGVAAGCTVLGAIVGWNRLPTSHRQP